MIPDSIMATQVGWNAIGVLGASTINDKLIEKLLPFNVIVIPDNDSAGLSFYKKTQKLFLNYGKIIQRIYFKGANDFSEYIISNFVNSK